MTLLPYDTRPEVEERAAIIEHEAGIERDEADRRAVLSAVRRHHCVGAWAERMKGN
jgi:hypothetical protein